MVLFWQPPSCFSQWSPSYFVMDAVSYLCAKQFMMAEQARRFDDLRAEEIIMSSADPTAHKLSGRGVRNLTTRFGTAFAKMPSLLETWPCSHRTRP